MSTSRCILLLCILVLAVTAGCGGHVTEYRYLDEVSSRGSRHVYVQEEGHAKITRGRKLDKVWIDPNFHVGEYHKILIMPVEVAPGLMNDEHSAELADYFKESMQEEIKGRLLLRVINDEEGSLPEKTLVLETGLTQLDKSSRRTNWGTMLLMGFPVDPTHVQMEGRIKDANTNKTVFIFADNRSASLLLGSNKAAWRKHIEDIANDLVLELAVIKAKVID